jgi:orotate phosphoribosyltransferase
MLDDVPALLRSQSGHFLLESGHHGSLWLDLERLCLRVAPIERHATELGHRLRPHSADVVCGPLVEGAFVALLVASALDVPFTYAERKPSPGSDRLYSVRYLIPRVLREEVRGKRVAIVNDVIGAGSAVRGTFLDLEACGATIVAIGALAVAGTWAATFAAARGIPLETLATMPSSVWEPRACPLCAAGAPLVDPSSIEE